MKTMVEYLGKILERKWQNLVGVSPITENGKENRTPYNKSKLPRYFGFVDTCYDSNKESFLLLTNRGKVLTNYIEDKGEEIESSKRYCINQNNRNKFIDLFLKVLYLTLLEKIIAELKSQMLILSPLK